MQKKSFARYVVSGAVAFVAALAVVALAASQVERPSQVAKGVPSLAAHPVKLPHTLQKGKHVPKLPSVDRSHKVKIAEAVR
jgi:hypothetical protein